MQRVLVVANRTLCEQRLLDEVRSRQESGPVEFHLLVPASHPNGSWTDGQVERQARERLEASLATLGEAGLTATGEVGDANPVTAVADVLRHDAFDEIIVSTLPTGISGWLSQNAVRRIRRFGLPVVHVVAEPVGAST